MSKLDYLLSLTPLETWRILRHRLPFLRGGPAWTANELMSSAKYGRGIRFAELLMRQEAVMRRHGGWEPLDFAGKRVVEVGCGPLGGYGPLAIFCGVTTFESAEPEWDESIISAKVVVDRYLSILHADLVGLYGPRMDFSAFLDALKTRMIVHRCGFESAPISGPVDIVLSQSCLEHVFPLDGTVAKLAEIQTPATRFLHLVDFGNHYPTDNPFEGLYEQPPDVYIARRGKAINLLREPDVLAEFQKKGIAARAIPARMAGDTYAGTVHPWWRERYDNAALFTQLSLVAGPPA
jgi:hypothetical protein